MDETKAFAKKNGYVLTLFGRKCHYPDIANSNPSVRAFNERASINARLQGSAADIIRRAMIRMEPALAQKKLGAQMLLQVHDELVFEVAEERGREDAAGDQARDGRRAAPGGRRSRCRSRSMRTRRTIGKRRIDPSGGGRLAGELRL